MVSGDFNFTTTSFHEPRNILQVATPKGVYDKKMIKELYEQVAEQVSNEYLVVVVPDDINLEIIV